MSDSDGMQILAQLMWTSAYQHLERISAEQHLETPAPKPQVPARASPPRFSPKVVVKGEVIVPRPPPNPFEWTLVGPGKKVIYVYIYCICVV